MGHAVTWWTCLARSFVHDELPRAAGNKARNFEECPVPSTTAMLACLAPVRTDAWSEPRRPR
jgi:hypothetical protein